MSPTGPMSSGPDTDFVPEPPRDASGGDGTQATGEPLFKWLPRVGTPGYHFLLAGIAIFILGPLGGITAAYMNFSLGFFVGGQVLAGILGSVVTYGYGPDGKHGANFMQTMAASVASMTAMGVLIQAMRWLGIPEPPTWQLVVYFLCIGMFGVGVGMLYTPILVDRLQLTYPSGLAVANILRALTDKKLLKRSVGQLGAGTGVGLGAGVLMEKVPAVAATHFSGATFGAGMIVGARIGVPAIVIAVIGELMTPWLRQQGLLGPEDPFRKVGFLVSLGAIMGAAIVDLTLIFRTAYLRFQAQRNAPSGTPYRDKPESTGRVPQTTLSTGTLIAWVSFWAVAVIVAAVVIMKVTPIFAIFGIVLAFLFVLINGISYGVSDSNPISSAFVVSVLLMALIGLTDPGIGLLAGAILLVSTSVGCDMQQDRSTGYRLGTNRVWQFRYQVVGVLMGAVLAVVMAQVFMKAYPVLEIDTFAHPEAKTAQWQSAMTYKFVGALRGITNPDPTKTKLLLLGLGIGFALELVRKVLRASADYQRFKASSPGARVTDFVIDAILLPSPYAASFGGFVDFFTSLNLGIGGIAGTSFQTWQDRAQKAKAARVAASAAAGDGVEPKDALPEDMSTTSLVGGGLIAGEALAALIFGIIGLLSLMK